MEAPHNPHPVFIPGASDVLVIAPHARTARPMDDINTGLLARSVAGLLGCAALVNEGVSRKELDYNRISQAARDRFFMARLEKAVGTGAVLFAWIHGMSGPSLEAERTAMGMEGDLDGLVGFGQPDRLTALEPHVDALIAGAGAKGLVLRKTRSDAKLYRGRREDNMNQWAGRRTGGRTASI